MSLTTTKQTITCLAAHKLIEGARAKALELGAPMIIAIVDESGILKEYERMDGAPLLSVGIAQDKAYSAVSFGMATHEWHEFIKNDPPLLDGIVKTDRLVVFGGGFPVMINDQMVGGIGVSGGHYSQDMEVAQAGLDALAASS